MLTMNRGVRGRGMSMLLLHRIIERDCVAGMAALPGGLADPVFADPPYHLLLNGDLHRPNNGMVDAGDVLVSPDGQTQRLGARTAPRWWGAALELLLHDPVDRSGRRPVLWSRSGVLRRSKWSRIGVRAADHHTRVD